ncbi:hypothetical protein vBRpoSV10_166 [Ruegeria phage vB_RpoS-V10]|nr:hypothetical protein vBRpoSV10_166 [Ruegeria phage vB_RpoS-V10]
MSQVSFEPVQAVRIKMHCSCGTGHFKYTGQSTLIDPITHSHRCTGCSRLTQLKQQFPNIEYFNAAEMEALVKAE